MENLNDMRYIKKGKEPDYMLAWKQDCADVGNEPLYKEFSYKEKLNDELRGMQHGICCYCQRRIDHFQGELLYGSHNEHLYPENRENDEMSRKFQMDFQNIYACCIDSRGHKKMEKRLRYCGEAKENNIIPHLIQERKCSDYFRYNILGEIIPNGSYNKWEEYEKREVELKGKILEAFKCIKVLNLNCITLVIHRNQVLQPFISIISKWPIDTLISYIRSYEDATIYQEFIAMKLQYMYKRLLFLLKE